MAELNASIDGPTGGNNHSGSTPETWVISEYFMKQEFAELVFVGIISAVEIPIMILTLFALCVLIKSNRSAPVLVIHLILSDLIQIIFKLIKIFVHVLYVVYLYCLMVGLYFMACVAVERYLLVSHSVWYKSHHSPKVCCVISVIIWFVPLIFMVVVYFLLSSELLSMVITCLIPYLIVILCFVGTWRGLSHAISLTPLKRKLILGSLFLVLVTYTFLILPFIILGFILEFCHININVLIKVLNFCQLLLFLNPLADCILYLFLRPDVDGLMKSVHCCCRTDTHQNSTNSRDEHSRDRSAAFACCVSVPKPAFHSRTACTSV